MRPEKNGRCKKHPSHKNSNGVCPNCLRDKLSNLSSSSSSSSKHKAGSSSTSSASSTAYSSYESDASSYVATPPERNVKRLFKRTLRSSLSFSSSKGGEKVKEERKSKKGVGKLWEKMVMGGGGRRLSHSKTVKEKSSSKWIFF